MRRERHRGHEHRLPPACCVTEEDVEAERFFRRVAALAFEEALARYDDVRRDRRAAVTYLVGELWRRTGDGARAPAWFDRVESEAADDGSDEWVAALAAQPRDQPREWLS